jgi:hypothetical protein
MPVPKFCLTSLVVLRILCKVLINHPLDIITIDRMQINEIM